MYKMMRMIRKVRHPYQVMETDGMAVGERYSFVHTSDSQLFHEAFVMGGVFLDSVGAARMLGHDLGGADLRVDMFLPTAPDEDVVTVHMDGWWPLSGTEGDLDEPALVYWKSGDSPSFNILSLYLGPDEILSPTWRNIVVPHQHWIDDPRLHVTDWSNPDTVIERAVSNESPVEFDRRMKAKLNAAMAKALGF